MYATVSKKTFKIIKQYRNHTAGLHSTVERYYDGRDVYYRHRMTDIDGTEQTYDYLGRAVDTPDQPAVQAHYALVMSWHEAGLI